MIIIAASPQFLMLLTNINQSLGPMIFPFSSREVTGPDLTRLKACSSISASVKPEVEAGFIPEKWLFKQFKASKRRDLNNGLV